MGQLEKGDEFRMVNPDGSLLNYGQVFVVLDHPQISCEARDVYTQAAG